METKASKSSVVKSVKGLLQKDPGVVYKNIDGSEALTAASTHFGSGFLLADIAIQENHPWATRSAID